MYITIFFLRILSYLHNKAAVSKNCGFQLAEHFKYAGR